MDNERRIFDRFQSRFPTKFKDSRGDFGNDVFLRDKIKVDEEKIEELINYFSNNF